MLGQIEQLLGVDLDLYATLIVWGLMFTRTLVMLLLVPFLGGKGVPTRVRLVVSFVLASFSYFVLYSENPPVMPDDRAILFAYFFKEVFFGLALGMTTVMSFYAIEAAGRIVDNQRGSANAQIFLPALGQVTIYGLLKYWIGIGVFLAMGGHIPFLKAFIGSFELVPVMSLPNIAPGFSPFLILVIRMSSDVLVLGMQLAAPVLIGVFLTDLVLGIANKMAPQIPVFEIGFMLKGYVGSAMVAVSIVVLVDQMSVFFDVMNSNVFRVIQYFSQ